MSRRFTQTWSKLLIVTTLLSGCAPTQPFFLHEDGDLSHFVDVATDIEYPDVNEPHLADAVRSTRPLTIKDPEFSERWELSLQDAVAHALQNSQTIRGLRIVRNQAVGQGLPIPPDDITSNPDFATTIYDPAIQETGDTGPEAALANFDTQLRTTFTYDRSDRPQNTSAVDANFLRRNLANWQTELAKRSAGGSQLAVRANSTYDSSRGFLQPRPLRPFEIDWLSTVEAEARHPLLRNAGVQVNRIPVILARINTDISLADLEGAVNNLVLDVERQYWNLYFSYRALEAAKTGRNSAHATWRRTKTLFDVGGEGGAAGEEAQARLQYFNFRRVVEQTLSELYTAESNLRYLMGVAATDGRLIQPTEEPTAASVEFDWNVTLNEGLIRRVEVRRQKWRIKQQELQLIAARNQLLPQFDIIALYRLLDFKVGGAFQEGLPGLVDPGTGLPLTRGQVGDALSDGRHQEWRLGFEFNAPLGFRRELATVRNRQLDLHRAKARLRTMELEIAHQLTAAVRGLHEQHQIAQTSFARFNAAKDQVEAEQTRFEGGASRLDLLLEAQRQQAEAERDFHQALVNYNIAITNVHFRKGSLLEYNGVAFAEGPSPAKAYSDAHTLARQRDASYYLDYGFTRPAVVSRGPVQQFAGTSSHPDQESAGLSGMEALLPTEEVPAPPGTLDEVESKDEAGATSTEEPSPYDYGGLGGLN